MQTRLRTTQGESAQVATTFGALLQRSSVLGHAHIIRRRAVLLGVLLLTIYCPDTQADTHRQDGARPQINATGLAPEEYEKLYAQALAHGRAKLGPKLRNPAVSQNGFDRNVLAALKVQRAFLETHSAAGDSNTMAAPNVANAPAWPRPAQASGGVLAQAPLRNEREHPALCREPEIRSVNGKQHAVIFTPQLPDNLYKIEGCFFGGVPGEVQLEPHPTSSEQAALPIHLQLKPSKSAWSETEIEAFLDHHLDGLLDTPVTLVIYPGRGHRLELPGCIFVAARGEPQLLTVISSPWVRLQASTTGTSPIQQLEYISPPAEGSDAPPDAATTSAFVIRSDTKSFGKGKDTFDFSHLNPGWVVDTVQLQTYRISCPGDVTVAESVGHWGVVWGPRSFTIAWQGDVCESFIPPSFSFSLSSSHYALRVWVVGPAGTQPI